MTNSCIEIEALEGVAGGINLFGYDVGGQLSAGFSLFGTSRQWTLDTSGNIYRSTGTGAVLPGFNVGVGAYYSNTGNPVDHFTGQGLSTTLGPVTVDTSGSGQGISLGWGRGFIPASSQDTDGELVGRVRQDPNAGTMYGFEPPGFEYDQPQQGLVEPPATFDERFGFGTTGSNTGYESYDASTGTTTPAEGYDPSYNADDYSYATGPNDNSAGTGTGYENYDASTETTTPAEGYDPSFNADDYSYAQDTSTDYSDYSTDIGFE